MKDFGSANEQSVFVFTVREPISEQTRSQQSLLGLRYVSEAIWSSTRNKKTRIGQDRAAA